MSARAASGGAADHVVVVGAGLAGAEAAFQIAEAGIRVRLIEMRPEHRGPAHRGGDFAELVCSNSLRSNQPENAVGLLKEELRALNSLIIKTAERFSVPAGGALAVDREAFSRAVTEAVSGHPLIAVERRRILRVAEAYDGQNPCILATGPLTDPPLAEDIAARLGKGYLHFFDAAAPLVEADSIDRGIVFAQSRYGKGTADYLNCPFDKEEYLAFHAALVGAELAEVKDFDRVFEGCMPVEVMAGRGVDAIRYGMMKPVGLRDPRTGLRPYAVAQLRQDNASGSLYNLVGFQTRLKFSEQRRVFRMIPGLAEAEFARYGVMHRNSFIQSPALLQPSFALRSDERLLFAGQLTGVEGYVESCASGLAAARSAVRLLRRGKADFVMPRETVLGSLQHYIAEAELSTFQPMNANFGLLPPAPEGTKKAQRKAYLLERARRARRDFLAEAEA